MKQQSLREMQCGGIGGQLYAESLANVLVIHLLRNYSIASPKLDDGETRLSQVQLQQILDYVQSYLDKSIGLNQLANLLGMNVHSFWKLFKRSTGMPPPPICNSLSACPRPDIVKATAKNIDRRDRIAMWFCRLKPLASTFSEVSRRDSWGLSRSISHPSYYLLKRHRLKPS